MRRASSALITPVATFSHESGVSGGSIAVWLLLVDAAAGEGCSGSLLLLATGPRAVLGDPIMRRASSILITPVATISHKSGVSASAGDSVVFEFTDAVELATESIGWNDENTDTPWELRYHVSDQIDC